MIQDYVESICVIKFVRWYFLSKCLDNKPQNHYTSKPFHTYSYILRCSEPPTQILLESLTPFKRDSRCAQVPFAGTSEVVVQASVARLERPNHPRSGTPNVSSSVHTRSCTNQMIPVNKATLITTELRSRVWQPLSKSLHISSTCDNLRSKNIAYT